MSASYDTAQRAHTRTKDESTGIKYADNQPKRSEIAIRVFPKKLRQLLGHVHFCLARAFQR